MATGCNWLPSGEGAGGVLKPVNKNRLCYRFICRLL